MDRLRGGRGKGDRGEAEESLEALEEDGRGTGTSQN